MLIALDPGMNSPGIAAFADYGRGALRYELVAAARLNTEEFADRKPGARWLAVAHALTAWVGKYADGAERGLDIVFELPQWYQRGKSKGDPNKLAGVLGVAANLTGILSCRYHVSVISPTPAEWIGQLPKVCQTCDGRKGVGRGKKRVVCAVCLGSDWNTPRGQRIRSRLNDRELALVPDQNDAIDAVGLGLWASGRLAPHHVFSNGRDGR